MESTENKSQLQLFELELPRKKHYAEQNRIQYGKTRSLSKHDLSIICRCRTKAFVPRLFSVAFVESPDGLNMTMDEYNRTKCFTFEQTKRIIKYLQIDPEEMGL